MESALKLYRRILEDGLVGSDVQIYADVLYDMSELYEGKAFN